VIVASFYAPRPEHPRWRDYLPSLALLQRSCDRLGLRHIIIGDAPVGGFEVFETTLPRELMPAILTGQAAAIDAFGDDLLLVGADCVVAKDPRPALAGGRDIAVTLGDFSDCRLNTGAIWIANAARPAAARIWRGALERMSVEWGDDQLALAAELSPLPLSTPIDEVRHGLKVGFLPCDQWNVAPSDVTDGSAADATVLHFRGPRKVWAAEWCRRHLGWS